MFQLIYEYFLLHNLIENFYIRLIRGSGIKGLTSLQNIFEYNKNFYLLRPLLNLNKEELLSVTKKSYSSWTEDPSNKNDKFLRVRIRKMQTKLQKEGFDPKRIIKTIDNLNIAKDSLDFYILKSEKKYLNFYKEGYATLKFSIFNNEAQEVIFRVIIKAIHFVSGEYYPPRSDSLKTLMKNLSKKSFKSSTLGGCLIEKNKNIISFFREDRNVAIENLNKKEKIRLTGEAGKMLSGGQAQRIAIARALYLKPKILILDEPTKSLDLYTEDQIFKDLIKMKKFLTIIIVSHNLRVKNIADKFVQF